MQLADTIVKAVLIPVLIAVLLRSASYVVHDDFVMHHLRPPTLSSLLCLQYVSHVQLNSSRSQSEISTCRIISSNFFYILDRE